MIKALFTGVMIGAGCGLCVVGGIIGGPQGTVPGAAVALAGIVLVLGGFRIAWLRKPGSEEERDGG